MKQLLQRLRSAFVGLAPRERLLVSTVGGLVVFALVWLGVVQPLVGAAAGAEDRVAMAEQRLEVMKRLRREYDEVSGRLSSVEERIRQAGRGNLRTNLEQLARRANVKIESMEPQASPANDSFREAKVEVTLKQVGLNDSIRYLHEIEAAKQALSVKALRMRSRNDGKGEPGTSLLDVTFTVSSFQPN
jgi:type II secretory pathway component PulM